MILRALIIRFKLKGYLWVCVMSMKKMDPYVISKIVVAVLICAILRQFIPPLATCLLLAVGYLTYEAYKK